MQKSRSLLLIPMVISLAGCGLLQRHVESKAMDQFLGSVADVFFLNFIPGLFLTGTMARYRMEYGTCPEDVGAFADFLVKGVNLQGLTALPVDATAMLDEGFEELIFSEDVIGDCIAAYRFKERAFKHDFQPLEGTTAVGVIKEVGALKRFHVDLQTAVIAETADPSGPLPRISGWVDYDPQTSRFHFRFDADSNPFGEYD